MTIGIIGSGNIGADLARKLRKLGHVVRISNSRGAESLKEFAEETGAVASTTEDVIKNSKLIFISVPQVAIPTLPNELFAALPADVIVVDTGNFYSARDGAVKEIDDEILVHSEWVAAVIGHPVLKAFNNITIHSLLVGHRPVGHPERFALTVSGDNEEHKKVLVDTLDAGLLRDSWRQQPGSPAYCLDWDVPTLSLKLQQAVRSELRIRVDVVMPRIFADLSLLENVQWRRDQAELPFEDILIAHKQLSEKK